ncbi:MAG: hypothetical protein ACRDH1_10335, partial [Actinomycetota bacterium]
VGNVRPPVGTVERLIRPGTASGIASATPAPAVLPSEARVATTKREIGSSSTPWKAVAAMSLGLLLLTLVAAARRRKTRT